MRDRNRIPGYAQRLAAVWAKVPDWRLSQLLTNVILDYISEHDIEPFYMEDEQFLAYIEKYVEEITKK